MAVRSVLIADSNPRLAELLAQLLADDKRFSVVGVCSTAAQALAQAREGRPDLVLVSEWLDGRPSAQLCRALRDAVPQAALLRWSHAPDALRDGQDAADAVLERGMTFQGLVAALQHVRALPRRRPDAQDGSAPEAVASVYRTSTATPVPSGPVVPGADHVDVDVVDGQGSGAELVLTCATCGHRLAVGTEDDGQAVAAVQRFHAEHDGCGTTLHLTSESPPSTPSERTAAAPAG